MTHVIEINSVCKTYDTNRKSALDNISFDVPEKSFFALLGLNGAGKTTLINILSGLSRRDSGSIKIFGMDIDAHGYEIRRRIGLMPQEVNLSPFVTVQDTLLYHLGYFGLCNKEYKEWMEHLLERLDLQHKMKMQIYKLSGGMKRRLMVARALITRPTLALLDEPTAGVDIDIRHNIYTFLREINNSGTTVILTTHYLEEANSLCKDYVLIAQGKVIKKGLMSDIRQEIPLIFRLSFVHIPDDFVLLPGMQRVESTVLEVSSEMHQLEYMFHYFNKNGLEILQVDQQSQLESYFLLHTKSSDGEKI